MGLTNRSLKNKKIALKILDRQLTSLRHAYADARCAKSICIGGKQVTDHSELISRGLSFFPYLTSAYFSLNPRVTQMRVDFVGPGNLRCKLLVRINILSDTPDNLNIRDGVVMDPRRPSDKCHLYRDEAN